MSTTSDHRTRPSIDREWAESLEGLRMKVEERWWAGYSGTTLCPGRIAGIDFEPTNEKGKPTIAFFLLELDSERGTVYHMRYDALLRYADETDKNFHRFKLPPQLMADPEGEAVAAP